MRAELRWRTVLCKASEGGIRNGEHPTATGFRMTGRTEVHIISDGAFKVDGGVLFGQAPKSEWQNWMPADRRNRVSLGLNCLLVRRGEKNYLVDTGIGSKHTEEDQNAYGFSKGKLLSELRAHGLTAQDIHGVVLTSLHFEHTGGCTRVNRRGELAPTFPKATYFVQREALEEAVSPTERGINGFEADDFVPLRQKGRLEVIDGEAVIAPGLQARLAGGPYQGHQIVLVAHGGERVAVLGDLAPTPYHLRLDVIAASDRQPEETLEVKRKILSEAVQEGWLLIFSHGVNEKAGYLQDMSGKLRLRPVAL